jgi:hypothetical protein
MITWIWNASPEKHRNLHDISIRMIYLNVAAIHTTANVSEMLTLRRPGKYLAERNLIQLLTHVLLSIATHTSYIEPLREEIEGIVETEGWTKYAIERMRKLDSFVKESQRLYGGDAGKLQFIYLTSSLFIPSTAMIVRLSMNDFTFSDGTFIPRGTNMAVTGRAINQDEVLVLLRLPDGFRSDSFQQRYYPNPHEFQGFRFADKDPLRWQMTSLNSEFMTYGIGRHAWCVPRLRSIQVILENFCIVRDVSSL